MGACKIKLTAEKEKDVRERVFDICAKNRIVVLEMKVATKTLEDVFLQLTNQEDNFYDEDLEAEIMVKKIYEEEFGEGMSDDSDI